MKNKAFTLIELLVVILIIGILAAIALPQYKKAVYKTKFTQAIQIGEEIASAEERHYLVNGKYTINLEELDITIPGFSFVASESTDTQKYYRNMPGNHQKNTADSIEIALTENYVNVRLRGYGGNNGPYYGRIFENENNEVRFYEGSRRTARNWGKDSDMNEWDHLFESLGMTRKLFQAPGWHIWYYK